MAYVKIRPRRGTASAWEYANPILAEGEMAFEVPDTGVGTGLINIKQGDGQTAWVNLPYAFNGASLDSKVNTLANTVATFDGRINSLSAQVSEMEGKVGNIRKIDIQATEPTDNLVLGQIWINSDMVTGYMDLSWTDPREVITRDITVNVGAVQTVYVIQNIQPTPTSIQWSISDNIAATIYNQSDTGCMVRANLKSESIRVTAKAILNGSVVYTAYLTMHIAVGGNIEIQAPVSGPKLIIGQTKRFTASHSLPSVDEILWTSSASYVGNIMDQSTDPSNAFADVNGLTAGTTTLTARAVLNGSYIADANLMVPVAGGALDKTSATLNIGDSTVFTLGIMNLDYDTEYSNVKWDYDGTNVINITGSQFDPSTNTATCTVTGVTAGMSNLYADIVKTEGGSETTLQRITAIVGVNGSITVEPKLASLQVGQLSEPFIITNTLASGSWDTIRVTASDDTIIRVEDPSNTGFKVRALNAGDTSVVVEAFKSSQLVTSDAATIQVTGRISMVETAVELSGIGTTKTLQCNNSLAPSQYSRIDWTTNAANVARVVSKSDSECLIEITGIGTAIITVMALDDEGRTVSSDTCTVTATA